MQSTTTVVVRVKKQGIKHKWVENEDGKVKCPYCDKIGKRTTISEHVSQKHVEESGRQLLPFQCNYCAEQFQASTHLRNHIARFHEIVRVQCPECDYSAKDKFALYTHYGAKHMPLYTTTTPSGEECNGCHKIMSKQASKYHVATCFVDSPFYNGCF
jgi:hypothetical protein